MAESVNSHSLSAVTEGHDGSPSTINSTSKTRRGRQHNKTNSQDKKHQEVNRKQQQQQLTSRKQKLQETTNTSATPGFKKSNLSSSSTLSKSSHYNTKRPLTPTPTQTAINNSNSRKEDTNLNSAKTTTATNSTTGSVIVESSDLRIGRKRSQHQQQSLIAFTQQQQQKPVEDQPTDLTSPVKKRRYHSAEVNPSVTNFTNSKSLTTEELGDCVARRTRSKTNINEVDDEPSTSASANLKRKHNSPVAKSVIKSIGNTETAVSHRTQVNNSKSNLLNYYRKTRKINNTYNRKQTTKAVVYDSSDNSSDNQQYQLEPVAAKQNKTKGNSKKKHSRNNTHFPRLSAVAKQIDYHGYKQKKNSTDVFSSAENNKIQKNTRKHKQQKTQSANNTNKSCNTTETSPELPTTSTGNTATDYLEEKLKTVNHLDQYSKHRKSLRNCQDRSQKVKESKQRTNTNEVPSNSPSTTAVAGGSTSTSDYKNFYALVDSYVKDRFVLEDEDDEDEDVDETDDEIGEEDEELSTETSEEALEAAADALSFNLMAQQPPIGPPHSGGQSATANLNNLSVASGLGDTTTASTTSTGTASDAATAGTSAGNNTSHADSESDDSEVGRLQALLEARGLPPHLFGALGPRMTHILHRTIGNSSSSRAQQLLQGLQSHDESQQLQAAIEMCQMLVMGNEDTLAGFPIKQVVPALIALLRMEHNFDIMNNACRALAYMLEALPRSSGTVVEAVPVFLEKLQVIQCMDVAEQSLTALEILSRRHNKAILQANGICACLTYLDFFSINAQRAALAITANCCLNLHSEEFHFVAENLTLLARMLSQQDKKSVESVCTVFCRLIESFQHDPKRLQEIASADLLKNCQQLLVVTPAILNTGTFTSVVRMLSLMCSNCPDLAISLLKSDIASTLLYLLTGNFEQNVNSSNQVELITRSPAELYEITCLIGELMPRLPTDGIFTVDALLDKPTLNTQDQVQWQWRDDRGAWHNYSAIDSRMIEAAHLNSEDEFSLSTLGRTYTIDFHSMQQINEDTGTTRPVQRKVNPNYVPPPPPPSVAVGQDLSASAVATALTALNNTVANPAVPNVSTVNTNAPVHQRQRTSIDARIACLKEERGLAAEFVKNLFNVLYEVYSSSAGPNVRYKCLRALLRMVYFATPEILKDVLKNQLVSSHIAGMMGSNDLRIVVGALQMAEILMQKLPEVFGTHFRREGVMYQITQLTDPNHPICANTSPKPASTTGTQSAPASACLQTNPFFIDGSNTFVASGVSSSTTTPSTSKSTQHYTIKTFSHAMNALTASTGNAVSQKVSLSLPSNNVNIISQMPSTSSHPSNSMAMPVSTGVITHSNTIFENTGAPVDGGYHHYSSSAPGGLGSSTGRNTPSSTGGKSRVSGGAGGGSSGGTTPKSSFLSSLNPARWGRQGSHHSTFAKDNSSTNQPNIGPSGATHSSNHGASGVININKSISNANLIAAGNREKARQWIRDQSISFVRRYAQDTCKIEGTVGQNNANGGNILQNLSSIIFKLSGSFHDCLDALLELKTILLESDISPFEVCHSGLIKTMLNYMTTEDGLVERDTRLRAFMHVFTGLPLEMVTKVGKLPLIDAAPFNNFVAKLNGCVTQLEQFPVKVHDFPTGPGGRSNTSALKFFNTHQLKCNLQRHPECTNLRQWKGGTVKIDPLAMVQAIERYLVVRGYGGIRGDSDDDSEDDMDDNVAAVVMSQTGFKHKLQFLIGEHVLPYNMTVYQAVKQFSPLVNDQSETDTEIETPLGNASIWVQQHIIYYRPVDDENVVSNSNTAGPSSSSSLINPKTTASHSHVPTTISSSSAAGSTPTTITVLKKSSKSSTKLLRKKTELWHEGAAPNTVSALKPFLISTLPTDLVSVHDASIDALCMLRIMNALNRHWEHLYGCVIHENLIPQSEFIHPKLTAKANRQLQDPLVIMTGNLPQWLPQIGMACPFLFPFETRHLLFYATSFDRDRALQRLLDTAPELNSSESSERVAPRLDRRKRTISRDDILKHADSLITDFGHSKALLEIQYENEVGTGLGPTLEFYALVSSELQRADLGLWNGGDSYKNSAVIADVVKSPANNIDEAHPITSQLTEANSNAISNITASNNANVSSGGTSLRSRQSRSAGVSTRSNLIAAYNTINQQAIVENGGSSSNDNALNMIIEQQNSDINNMQHHVNPHQNTGTGVRDDQVTSQTLDNRSTTDNSSSSTSYVNPTYGLFPLPMGKSTKVPTVTKAKNKFRFLGKLMAKAVMDSRMLDLPFATPFYRWLLHEEHSIGLADLAWVAPEVQTTLVRLQELVHERELILSNPDLDAMEKTEKIEQLDLDGCIIADLGLDFVLPGFANVELCRAGRDTPVTVHNLHQYISLVTYWFLVEGVQKQFEALREGFDSVFSSQRLRIFYPEELENVFCGSNTTNYQRWEVKMLQDCCRTDHGFTQDSSAIQNLFDILSSYNREEQRLFLQFVTGSPRLPTGGFKSLTPALTIVRKTLDGNQNPDEYLPSVMTCVNYLKLPDYSSREVMREKLKMASHEGSMSFHLS